MALRQFRQALKAYSDFMLYGRTPTEQHKAQLPARDILTPRELEVLILIAEGLSSKELADQLGVSFKTVVCHRTRIMDKLDIHNVAALVRYAIREKLITP
jgi:DNA-binding NarL/FixJ family response regulator